MRFITKNLKVFGTLTDAVEMPEEGNIRFCRNLVVNSILGYASRDYGDEETTLAHDFVLTKEEFLNADDFIGGIIDYKYKCKFSPQMYNCFSCTHCKEVDQEAGLSSDDEGKDVFLICGRRKLSECAVPVRKNAE